MGRTSRIIAVGMVTIMCGCAGKSVMVPVSSCPQPVIGNDPVLAVGKLKSGDSVETVLKAFSSSLEACKGRVKELTLQLEAYRTP